MAESSNIVRLRDAYLAFAKGDIDTLQSIWSPDISWHTPGSNPLAGDYEGVPAVLGFLGRVLDAVGDEPQEPAGRAAVADAVVEDQRELHDATRCDLAVDDPGAFDGPTRTEDRDLGVVDDRG